MVFVSIVVGATKYEQVNVIFQKIIIIAKCLVTQLWFLDIYNKRCPGSNLSSLIIEL